MPTQPITPILANDPGASGLRLFGHAGHIAMPAHVAHDGAAQIVKIAGLGRRKPPIVIQSDTENLPPFYVGDEAAYFGRLVTNLDHERQTGTPEMKAILYAALTAYQQAHGVFKNPLSMGVALPNQFISGDDGERNKAAVKAWLTRAHAWNADGQPFAITINDTVVTSQGASALFDYLLSDKGEFLPARKDHFKKEVGVISIGFDTVELTVVANKTLVPAFTAGEKLGARRLLRLHDPRELYQLAELEPRLRAGALDVAAHLPAWESEINGFIERKWGAVWKRFAAVVIVGGGALLLKDSFPYRFNGKAFVPEAPTLAVARGLYKLMLMQANRAK
jgi:hypothetical protein